MRNNLFTGLIFILLTANCFSQKNKSKGNPPGTIQVNDTLYADITEVANVHWREYLHYLLGVEKDTLGYEEALPDSLVWNSDTTFNEMSEYYFRHPGFNDYPVVGISYEKAIEYCKWRTFAANYHIYVKQNKIKDWRLHLTDTFPIRFYYRLPTKAEWEAIAAGSYSIAQYPYGYSGTYTKWKGKQIHSFNCNYKSGTYKPDTSKLSTPTAPIKSFFKNTSGVYNMIGNIAEMVSEKGIAKGGSFYHPLDSCTILSKQSYNKPEKWLGFRCVAVKINQ